MPKITQIICKNVRISGFSNWQSCGGISIQNRNFPCSKINKNLISCNKLIGGNARMRPKRDTNSWFGISMPLDGYSNGLTYKELIREVVFNIYLSNSGLLNKSLEVSKAQDLKEDANFGLACSINQEIVSKEVLILA